MDGWTVAVAIYAAGLDGQPMPELPAGVKPADARLLYYAGVEVKLAVIEQEIQRSGIRRPIGLD